MLISIAVGAPFVSTVSAEIVHVESTIINCPPRMMTVPAASPETSRVALSEIVSVPMLEKNLGR